MAENSKIEWCDHTVNLWWGCEKVNAGCKNCYAEYFSDVRYKNNYWRSPKRKRIKSAFSDLDKYQRQAEKAGIKLKIFCGSMMDIFEDNKPLENPTEEFSSTFDLRFRLWVDIYNGKYENLIFLFLTKRPQNIMIQLPMNWLNTPSSNIWLGTSISDQETSNLFVKRLSAYKGANLFLSIEPQVGSIDSIDLTDISWVIQGGESGPKKRPFDINWAYAMKAICKSDNISYFFKQIDKVQQIPEDLKIQEFPKQLTNGQ